jgi:hypothetical protein
MGNVLLFYEMPDDMSLVVPPTNFTYFPVLSTFYLLALTFRFIQKELCHTKNGHYFICCETGDFHGDEDSSLRLLDCNAM